MVDIESTSGSPHQRLQSYGFELPTVSRSSPYDSHRVMGSSVHVSGQLPYRDGVLLGTGALGREVNVESARGLARQAVVNALAVAADALGGLEHVRIAQMLVFVASTPDFGGQSTVADAASELLVEVLGENGRHARTAIGVASLPRNSPVEIQLVCGPA